MMNLLRKINRVLLPLVMIATLLLVFNATVNTHTHILEDGTIIVHAHPFKTMGQADASESNSADHTHSKKEFDIISVISNFLLVTTILLFLFNILFYKTREYGKNDIIQIFRRQYQLVAFSYRGPPAL
ncbi:MAG: hypothetical protein N4A72_19360 [Bacteroidales bacterium]|jgi:hypothetical protein|nr:hypothetical protein [Bacteroidales bacterium]